MLARLGTSAEGLSTHETQHRLAESGPNELATARLRSKVAEFLRASANPLVVILLVAGGAAAVLGEVTNAALIASMVFLSAGLNFWQTFRSERAVRRLQEQIAPTATVRRDGVWDVQGPQRWDIRVIRNFMLVIGPVSSIYDFLTFFVLLRVFQFGEVLFQTGWFVESLATQTLVLFVIRTTGRPWSNRPSGPLTVTTLLIALVGAVFPYTPAAGPLGFAPLPPAYFLFLVLAVGTYLILVEVVKAQVMRRLRPDAAR